MDLNYSQIKKAIAATANLDLDYSILPTFISLETLATRAEESMVDHYL